MSINSYRPEGAPVTYWQGYPVVIIDKLIWPHALKGAEQWIILEEARGWCYQHGERDDRRTGFWDNPFDAAHALWGHLTRT